MEKTRLSKTQMILLGYILQEYKANGKFMETNRQLGNRFNRAPHTMQYNLKALQQKGYVDCKVVIEPSGYVIRYVTPKNL